MNEMWILILMVGLPRSGKTTLALTLDIPIVNPDSVRLALHGERFLADAEPMVWTLTRYMVVSLFLAGHTSVVLDATNTTRKRRDAWVDDRWARDFSVMQTPASTCMQRALDAGDTEIVPIIEKMADEYEPLADDEIEEITATG